MMSEHVCVCVSVSGREGGRESVVLICHGARERERDGKRETGSASVRESSLLDFNAPSTARHHLRMRVRDKNLKFTQNISARSPK